MNVVIDTNVLISALWSKEGTCAKTLYKVLNYELTVVYDQRILHEYKIVLERPSFILQKMK
ncbi:MAG: putative toxin-antitoxin system toxin component, PIN family [Lachnospiraceae bacterium]|nr:putative toxin-antitoxin system toxin component, PIN family [Lachnospiraceae bacterium]